MVKNGMIYLCAVWAIFLSGCRQVPPPDPMEPVPQQKQVDWQKRERIAFVHFGMNTFTDKEWGYGDADLSLFSPTQLDCEQWVRTFLSAGIKEVVLTAKHHDGFCLWPTKLTEYCIRNTPYKEGKGDIVGELSAACRKYGIKFGIYLSPWDRNHAGYGTLQYVEYFYAQLRELLTAYGEISEVWFDGANGGDGYYGGACEVRSIDRLTYYNFPRAYKLVEDLQPTAVIFSDGGPGCRWIGNERGIAGSTNWSFLRSADVHPAYEKYYELPCGHPDGDMWCAGECDVSIRPRWFYHEDDDNRVRSVENLVDLYYKSVGRNAVFMLNFPPDKRGLIHSTDSLHAAEAYKRVQEEMGENLLKGLKPEVTNTRGGRFKEKAMTDGDYDTFWATEDGVVAADVVFRLPQAEKVNRVLLQEYIPLGQRVSKFVVEYLNADNEWVEVDHHDETTTIGYKRILRFSTIQTSALRIRFMDARGCLCISTVEAYYSGSDQAFVEEEDMLKIASMPFQVIDDETTAKISDNNASTVAYIRGNRVVIDLGGEKPVSGLYWLPDQGEKRTGLISNYRLTGITSSGEKVLAAGEFSNVKNNPIMQRIHFLPVACSKLILEAVRMVDDADSIGVAELKVIRPEM